MQDQAQRAVFTYSSSTQSKYSIPAFYKSFVQVNKSYIYYNIPAGLNTASEQKSMFQQNVLRASALSCGGNMLFS
jgi:hypothetical protein